MLGNVLVEGDRVHVVFDAKGVREVRGIWHRPALEVDAGTGERVSSLEAARRFGKVKEIGACARLLYVPDAADPDRTVLRPVWRLAWHRHHGRPTLDVEVVR
jgi:hypothetical protein